MPRPQQGSVPLTHDSSQHCANLSHKASLVQLREYVSQKESTAVCVHLTFNTGKRVLSNCGRGKKATRAGDSPDVIACTRLPCGQVWEVTVSDTCLRKETFISLDLLLFVMGCGLTGVHGERCALTGVVCSFRNQPSLEGRSLPASKVLETSTHHKTWKTKTWLVHRTFGN